MRAVWSLRSNARCAVLVGLAAGASLFAACAEKEYPDGLPDDVRCNSCHGSDTNPVFRRTDAWGMYSYVEARLTRRYYPGFLFDIEQALTRQQGETTTYSPYFTIWLSEFQRLRLQYTYLTEPANHQSQFFLQWTAVLGSHVHGFRDR